MSGVMPSMTPKIRPVRRASLRWGRCRAAPLRMATAKASVDMASPIASVARTFMGSATPGWVPPSYRNIRRRALLAVQAGVPEADIQDEGVAGGRHEERGLQAERIGSRPLE